MREYVLAVDPGVATGWATCHVPDLIVASGVDDQLTFCRRADAWLSYRRADAVVVCERFLVTHRTATLSQQPASLEVIGALRYMAEKYDAEFAPLQAPSDAKNFCTDPRLKKVGWWTGNDHARDALRHLVLYLVNGGDKRVLEMIK